MLTSALLVAAVSGATPPVPVAFLGFQSPADQRELADTLGTTLSLRLAQSGWVRVTTPADVAAVLGLERQRQLLGCAESTCIAELTGALGARAVITGALAKVGDVFQLSVKVLDASTSAILFSSLERHGDVAALLTAADRLGAATALEVGRRFGLVESRLNPAPLVGLGVGGALGVAGAALLALAGADHAALLAKQPRTLPDAVALAKAGESKQGLGLGLAAGGVAVLVASGLWYLLTPRIDAPVAVAAGPGGVTVWGRF